MDRLKNIRALKLFLKDRGVTISLYSIGFLADDSLCLTLEDDGMFHVFISDHGCRFEEKVFENDNDACDYFANRIIQM